MARQIRKSKKVIYVFCEGESEREYAEYLQSTFTKVAVLHIPPPVSSCLFEDTKRKFDKEARFRNNAEVIDEIWFFFDAEDTDANQWDKRLKIIKQLRRLRKKPNIRVRLLMTSACVEYWSYIMKWPCQPSIQKPTRKMPAAGFNGKFLVIKREIMRLSGRSPLSGLRRSSMVKTL